MADVNYSDEMVETMVATYEAAPTIDTARTLAEDMGKSVKSVVAKLVSLGVYKKKERIAKNGGKIVQKAQLVKMIQDHYGIEVPSLQKATKIDLQKMVDSIA